MPLSSTPSFHTYRSGMPTLYEYEARYSDMPCVKYIFKYNAEMQRNWNEYKNERQASRNWPAHFTERDVDQQENKEPSQSLSDVLGLYMETSEDCIVSSKRPRNSSEENQDLSDTKRLKENKDPLMASTDMEID